MKLQTTYLEAPTEEQRENVRKSLNCTVESINKDVQYLIEWFEKQPHLPNCRDEHLLASSLLQCQNSLEKTKRRLEKYFNAKASLPDMFCDRNPCKKDIEAQKNLAMFVPLRKLTPDGYRVVLLYISKDLKTKTELPSATNFFKLFEMSNELLRKLDYSKGVILLHDGANMNLPFVKALSYHLPKMVPVIQSGTPISYVKLYYFNVNKAFEALLTIARTFLNKKLTERMEIFKKSTDVCKVLPKEIIPKEYGGDEIPLEQLKDLWFNDLKNNYDYLESVEKLASDLSKVPSSSATTEAFGTEGSFRSISVD